MQTSLSFLSTKLDTKYTISVRAPNN